MAIAIGYLSRALREDRYSGVDYTLLRTLGLGGRNDDRRDTNPLRKRIVAFETFMGFMADQQLFTALSLVVALYVIHHGSPKMAADISGFSYSVATNLALWSILTHLSAMTILGRCSDKTNRLQDVRVILALATIALLIPQFVAAQRLDLGDSLLRQDQLGHASLLLTKDASVRQDAVFYQTLAAIGLISCAYASRIAEIYSTDFRQSPDRWVMYTCSRLTGLPSEQAIRSIEENTRQKDDERSRLLRNSQLKSTFESAVRMGLVVKIVAAEMGRSFLAELNWLLFYIVFCSGQFSYSFAVGYDAVGYEHNFTGDNPISLKWGFGQILPVVLLLLPLISAGELYSRTYHSVTNSEEAHNLQV